MKVYESLKYKTSKLAVIGLGYVGLPLAVAFADKFEVIGFDINPEKIDIYRKGIDVTGELENEALLSSNIDFTYDETCLKEACFIVVAVPTPINGDKTPDLSQIISASKIIGRNLSKGSVVVYESTVYPGVTEEICCPILEKESGLQCGIDFKIGYSPERINPGDKIHTLRNVKKVVSAMDNDTLEQISFVYDSILDAGTWKASSIRTAEAIKVVENSQRDINIAFMNEMAMAFDCMGIDTNEVVDGMNTKWNALGFRPGLVGGHCIGVDPYYFVYEAERLGYTSQIVSAGRRINNYMSRFIVESALKMMIHAKLNPVEAKVVILGVTFKENCADIRNTRVSDIIFRLREYGINPIVIDPWADEKQLKKEYDINLTPIEQVYNADCIIHAVAHRQFQTMGVKNLANLFGENHRLLLDIKGEWSVKELECEGIKWWRL